MGRPYEKELSNLNLTYREARNVSIDNLKIFFKESQLPLIAVGSGGSLTAACMAALLHQQIGQIARYCTPLELISSNQSLRDVRIIFFSAGGRNSDIINAFRFAANSDAKQLVVFCLRGNSPLAELAKKYSYAEVFEFVPSVGKDGFLATNSLIAFVTILIRVYQDHLSSCEDPLPDNLPSYSDIYKGLNNRTHDLLNKDTIMVLYGSWGTPAAIDAESKFTESALKHVLTADFRNFAHGRHYWLAKKGSETGVVALVTPDDIHIVDKTLNLLPKKIPVLKISSMKKGPVSALDLLNKILFIVNIAGNNQGVDPGRPRVPIFGRKIYNLHPSYRSRVVKEFTNQEATAIKRKSKCVSISRLNSFEIDAWEKAYRSFLSKLEHASFGAVVFDYDGTICDAKTRYYGPSERMIEQLTALLKKGIIIGIATGRGKSVRQSLQQMIPAKYWPQIIIGFYNCSDIGKLADEECPRTDLPVDSALEKVNELLRKNKHLSTIAKVEYRPKQTTVEPIEVDSWHRIKAILYDIKAKIEQQVQILESSHSIDIVAPGVSKLDIVSFCQKAAAERGNPDHVLSIGDKGEWPGNDFALLSTPYSLSVDSVSPDFESCWNISPAGYRSVQATFYYIGCFSLHEKLFTFSQRKEKNK